MSRKIVITGATGFVGKKLCLELFKRGYELKILCRDPVSARKSIGLPADFIRWDVARPLDANHFEDAAGVIHLAGESVAGGRWTKDRKEKILLSRTETTAALCKAMQACQRPPRVLVGAGAIGIYGDAGDTLLTETSTSGTGFLADVCRFWESAYEGFKGRCVVLRTGVVLGYGGALDKMLLPFRLGAGGPLASGNQWMSWIHIDDLVKMYIYCLENDQCSGAINAVAPTPVRNTEFTKQLGRAVGMPAFFPVPKPALKIIFGEMSSILLDSQRVSADKIRSLGFSFSHVTLPEAFGQLLSPAGHKGCHVFEAYQWVPG